MAGLLAFVADLLATRGFLGAITRIVTRLAAIVALHAVDALACRSVSKAVPSDPRKDQSRLTRHVAVAAARVARFGRTAAKATTAAAAIGATVRTACLRAVACDMPHFAALRQVSPAACQRGEREAAYLVALGLPARHATPHGALSGNVASLTTLVA